jgi:tetratricopeptide (TPR) repeat protein
MQDKYWKHAPLPREVQGGRTDAPADAQMGEKVEKEHSNTYTSMLNIEIMSNIGTTLLAQGKYEEAEQIYRQTLELMEKVLGKEHPEAHAAMMNMGTVLLKQGKYEEAEQTYRPTLVMMEKVLGKEHPNTLLTMMNMGTTVPLNQGKFEEAERMRQLILELKEI